MIEDVVKINEINSGVNYVYNKNLVLKDDLGIDTAINSFVSNNQTFETYKRYEVTPGIKKKYGAEIKLIHDSKTKFRLRRRPRKNEQLNWNTLLAKPLEGVKKSSKSIIYKITNNKELGSTGLPKFYIGKTKGTVYHRMLTHFRSALLNKGCPHLRKAIKTYGINAFKVSILYQGPHINTMEHKLIKDNNATVSDFGYNVAN